MRVVCEFCKTVYNIPDAKLVREVSQATCKVCQNRIVIRKPDEGTPADALIPAFGVTDPRQPQTTPTRVSPKGEDLEPTVSDPAPETMEPTVADAGSIPMPPPPRVKQPTQGGPSSLAATLQQTETSNLASLPETELSNSWREAIVDNRETVALLRKLGAPAPPEDSTAEGPKVRSASPMGTFESSVMEPTVASPPPPGAAPAPRPAEEKLELATSRPAPTNATGGSTTAVSAGTARVATLSTPPRRGYLPGASKGLSLAAGLGGSLIVAAQLWNGSWGAGLSGWISFGAAVFVAIAGLLNSLTSAPGAGAVFGIGFLAGTVAVLAMLAVFLTGGPRTRLMAEAHPFLAPLARFEVSLRKARPEPPAATPAPGATSAASPAASPAASGTP